MPASSSTITAASRETPSELLDVDQCAVDRPRRDPRLVGQFASGAAGRGQPDHPITGGLIQRAQHAGGVRLPGARERLDDLDTVTATRRDPDDLRLLVGQPPVRRGQRPIDLALGTIAQPASIRSSAESISRRSQSTRSAVVISPSRVRRTSSRATNQSARPRTSATGAPWAAACANSWSTARWSNVLERSVSPCSPASRAARRSRARSSAPALRTLAEPGSDPRSVRSRRSRTACEELGDFVAAESVLGRSGLNLLPPGVRLDPVLLALARVDRGRLRRALGPQREAALRRRPLHVVTSPRELLKRRLRHIPQLGRALPDRPPLQPEPLRDLGP